jgi:protein-S-isoprenylcysteine O-methyltransferase Ste14
MEAAVSSAALPLRAPPPPVFSKLGLRRAAGNLVLATAFFIAAIPAAVQYNSSLANLVWIAGAAVMGVFSLIRLPPRSVTITPSTVAASFLMLLIPCLMRPAAASTGLIAAAGLIFEFAGAALTQVARLYLGRSFGILPANRRIVSRGPFSIVRHPIYIGWLVLSLGFAMSYPSIRNFAMITLTLPFMVWRIQQEETHLRQDPAYCEYANKVRFRLWPGVI